MKEIRFRCWDKKKKEMSQVSAIRFQVNGEDAQITTELRLIGKNHYILMQYTGLKDKSGREIYEGDIVKDICTICSEKTKEEIPKDISVKKTLSGLWEVYYLSSRACFLLRQFNVMSAICLTKETLQDSEVISNIYENSHLLKEKK